MSGSAAVQILRAGRFIDANGAAVAFTREDLRSAARSYDPKLRAAPLVIGHPRNDRPARGWVASLSCRDDRLYAVTERCDPGFLELVRTGAYKKVSSSLHTRSCPGNPCPGSWYLKHVGFLGAAAPAVKGLAAVQLSGSPRGVVSLASPVVPDPIALAEAIRDEVQRWQDAGQYLTAAQALDRLRKRNPTEERIQQGARLTFHRFEI